MKTSEWYQQNLGAKENFSNDEKAIMDFANLSIFLVKTKEKEKFNFTDVNGHEHFSVTFEVNGLLALESLHNTYKEKEMNVGEIEDRGHTGRNFVFL